jgi:hypothetical protein
MISALVCLINKLDSYGITREEIYGQYNYDMVLINDDYKIDLLLNITKDYTRMQILCL